MINNKLAVAALAGLVMAAPAVAEARDQIRIVGSSTVFPYTQAVSEEFANKASFSAPVVESTGTGGGMKIFCQGIGTEHADITGASRAMKKSEWKLCNDNGVKDITEILIGYDGLSIAVSRGKFTITRLPRGSRFSRLTVPPCRLTKERTIVSPRPLPRSRPDMPWAPGGRRETFDLRDGNRAPR